MIDARELRIGNWLINADGVARQVEYVGKTIGFENEIGGTDKYQKDPIFSYDIMDLQPIPLTPEILEKAGFENIGRYYIGSSGYELYKKGKVELMQPKKGDPFKLAIYETKIEYLHQLQNLFFTLTGTELTINL